MRLPKEFKPTIQELADGSLEVTLTVGRKSKRYNIVPPVDDFLSHILVMQFVNDVWMDQWKEISVGPLEDTDDS